MKLVVGLGNPGLEYQKTRHNAGFMVVERLARRHAPGAMVRHKFHAGLIDTTIGGEKCVLAQPTTYMNRSGQSVVEVIGFYKLEIGTDLLVITDDLAIDTGTIRVRETGGAGGHNGLRDIEQRLGTDAYARLRVGVGPKPPVFDQADFVLGRFRDDEATDLERSLEHAADAVECWVREGAVRAMNLFNARQKPERPPAPKRERATDGKGQPKDPPMVQPNGRSDQAGHEAGEQSS